MSLGSLVIDLAANTARLSSDMGKAVGIVENAVGKINRFTGFLGAGAFGVLAKQVFDAADAMSDAAKRAGANIEAFSSLAYAAKQSDVEIGSLETSIAKMNKTIGDASLGIPAAQTALSQLGLSAKDLIGLSLDKQFQIIGQKLKELGSQELAAALGADIFGKSVADILPLLLQGKDGIAKLTAEARDVGAVMSNETRAGIEAADEAIKKLSASWQGLLQKGFGKIALAFTSGPDDPILKAAIEIEQLQEKIKRLNETGLAWADKGKTLADYNEKLRLAKDRFAELSREVETTNNLTRVLGQTQIDGRASLVAFAEAESAAREKAFDEEKKREAAAQERRKKYAEENLRLAEDKIHAWDEFLGKAALGVEDTLQDAAKIAKEGLDEFTRDNLKALDAQLEETTVFAEQAARNVQDAFANFLFDPFQDGLKGMLLGFINIIRRMVAEALAADILKKLTGGSGGLADFFATILGGLSGKGGGSGAPSPRAGGGPIIGGRPYLVGEKGPELFMSKSSGSIVPNGKFGGSIAGSSVVFAPTTNVSGSGLSAEELLPILQRNSRETVAAFTEAMKRSGLRTPVF